MCPAPAAGKLMAAMMLKFSCTCVLLSLAALAQSPAKLVWADEFNDKGAPDATKWGYDTGGGGWGNQELQFYTKARPENARVENGKLILTVRKEDYQGTKYTSARLVTRGKASWTYGWFEVRAKLPAGRGTWPAIWMLSDKYNMGNWPASGEIDIMEHVGFDPGRIHASIHCAAYNHVAGTQKTATAVLPDATNEFHVYAINWTANFIEAYIDGKRYFRFENERENAKKWPFDGPFYLILNVAAGGSWGGQKGIDDSIWPRSLEIDYVRVHDRKP